MGALRLLSYTLTQCVLGSRIRRVSPSSFTCCEARYASAFSFIHSFIVTRDHHRGEYRLIRCITHSYLYSLLFRVCTLAWKTCTPKITRSMIMAWFWTRNLKFPSIHTSSLRMLKLCGNYFQGTSNIFGIRNWIWTFVNVWRFFSMLRKLCQNQFSVSSIPPRLDIESSNMLGRLKEYTICILET